MNESKQAEAAEQRPMTVLENFKITLRGFDTEERARSCGNLVGLYVRELSRQIDLSTLDGITIAADYEQALLDLDRGYDTSHRLTPSDEFAIGVAMTPAVLRDGQVKSHIVMNAWIALGLQLNEGEEFSFALHTLAHECAHVEVTARLMGRFPAACYGAGMTTCTMHSGGRSSRRAGMNMPRRGWRRHSARIRPRATKKPSFKF